MLTKATIKSYHQDIPTAVTHTPSTNLQAHESYNQRHISECHAYAFCEFPSSRRLQSGHTGSCYTYTVDEPPSSRKLQSKTYQLVSHIYWLQNFKLTRTTVKTYQQPRLNAKMGLINKKTTPPSPAPASASKKMPCSIADLQQNKSVWYKIHVLIYDLRHFHEADMSYDRLAQVADRSYIDAPYFTPKEAEMVRNTRVRGKKTLEMVVEKTLMEGLEKWKKGSVESGDCAARDLAPVLERLFGIDPMRLDRDTMFLALMGAYGLRSIRSTAFSYPSPREHIQLGATHDPVGCSRNIAVSSTDEIRYTIQLEIRQRISNQEILEEIDNLTVHVPQARSAYNHTRLSTSVQRFSGHVINR
ncbi:hypothetical protein FKW77_008426 [Venturia effusa]|uniref:Uncharacterized protein n=1 Tax=Venturia effusa TaxID=50376 RepID=A0A517LEH2_9PEZI|nr:hypothetical protein FKW77_008426 [Venturia effusa]